MTIDIADLDKQASVSTYCQLRSITEIEPWLMGVNQWQPRNQTMAMLWYVLAYQLKNDTAYLDEADKISRSLLSRLSWEQ
jgi:hypothetical protein